MLVVPVDGVGIGTVLLTGTGAKVPGAVVPLELVVAVEA